MPKITEKDKIISFSVKNAIDEIHAQMLDFDDSSEEDMVDDILDELVEDIILVTPYRRGVYNSVPKSMKWSIDILTQLYDNRFLQILRVSRIEFNALVSLISDDPVFNKPHSCQQFPIEYQLAIVLYRLGSSGEGASLNKIAAFFGVGDGGTIDKLTRRIFKAFLNLQSKYIFWPNAEERTSIVTETYSELPFCIGYVDGSEIPLAEAPVINGVSFFSRTHKYSIKVQVICDHKLHIRHIVVGNPGSVHDSKIFKNCEIYKESQKYFSNHQWIAGDSAYSLSPTVITPYRSNSTQMDSKKRKEFNRRHSTYRVRVEHCFGSLKEKFNSLKGLKMRINSAECHSLCCQWIVVCCILHNILLHESGVEIPLEFNEDDGVDEEQDNEDDVYSTTRQYEFKRKAIYSLLFD